MHERKHLGNVAGIMLGIVLIVFGVLFCLWQLDIIVSGPVWWSGDGHGWSHTNGAYCNDYFQCFLWKTTIGQAYDTLFLFAFLTPIIGFVIGFVSVWLWDDPDYVIEGNKLFIGKDIYEKVEEVNTVPAK